jgi:four helix bundle protein
MQRFTDLKVWQKSHALALEIYKLTSQFPSEKRFGLTSQLRRAALSVPTNIAEGSKRQRRQDYARFINIAEGSLAEAEYLLMFGRDLGCVDSTRWAELSTRISEIARMLNGLRAKVETNPRQ